jgi:hypothetical protein
MISRFFASLGRLTIRYPFCTVCIVVSVALAGANVWLRMSVIDLTARQQEQAREGDNMLKMIARGSQIRAELTAARAATQRIAANLVVEKNIPENFWYFYKIEQDTQAKLVELQQRPALLQDTGAPTSYKRVPYVLKFSGPFRSVVSALEHLEFGPRIGRIDAFQMMRQDPVTDHVTLQLDFELLGVP